MNKLLILLYICLMPLSLEAQSLCGTPALPQPSGVDLLKQSVHGARNLNSTHFFKLFFHVLRSSNGVGGVSVMTVQSAYNMLNEDFNAHSIIFIWDGTIY